MEELQATLPSDASDVSATREPIFSVIKNRAGSENVRLTPSTPALRASASARGDNASSEQHSAPLPMNNGSLSVAAGQFLRSIPDLSYMLVPPVVESARE